MQASSSLFKAEMCSQPTVQSHWQFKKKKKSQHSPWREAAHFSEAAQTTNLVGELAAERLVLEAARVVQVLAVHLPGQHDAELHHLLHGDGREGLHRDVIVQLRRGEESHSSVWVCNASANVIPVKKAHCSPLGPDQLPSPSPLLWPHLL